jgi:hypothetical protein
LFLSLANTISALATLRPLACQGFFDGSLRRPDDLIVAVLAEEALVMGGQVPNDMIGHAGKRCLHDVMLLGFRDHDGHAPAAFAKFVYPVDLNEVAASEKFFDGFEIAAVRDRSVFSQVEDEDRHLVGIVADLSHDPLLGLGHGRPSA